ncbi:YggT family protein [Glaciecola sp. KUL10]|uniref:YggT family protein n=1 Tax=Glaciecola sp. (strain KUL10) TaxID=2161813 RepID=UPI000D7882CF|nr:YggT family protein [Glaciecola sp. KUL10]GBL05571.1 hypothetical protein KUL10_28970 [Glaciecola sp. KUL10]
MVASLYLLNFLFDAYIMIILMRTWMQFVRADYYNPFSQFVVKVTQPVVGPLRRFIPPIGRFDTSLFLFALAVIVIKYFVLQTLFGGGAFAPALAIAIGSLKALLIQFLNLVFYVLIIRAIFSFISQGNNPVELVMIQLTEPFLAPVRKVIPPMGGLDFSILVVILALNFVTRLIEHGF